MKNYFIMLIVILSFSVVFTGCSGNDPIKPTSTYSVSGKITGNSSDISGVKIEISPTLFATSDASGNYTIENVPNGSYTITPSKNGFTFTPATLSATVNSSNVANNDFAIVAPDPNEYINADGINGGILFDKFWSLESGYDQSSPNLTKLNASADFYRCKQCHAWDLMGRNGSYNNRAPKTNRPNVADRNLRTTANNLTPQALFNAIKNGLGKTRKDISADLSTYNPATNSTVGDQMPNFSQLLTDAQIWNLVKFLKVEALDVTQLYDATYSGTYPTGTTTFTNVGKNGDATKGLTFYTANCQLCHGTDGKYIPNLDGTTGMTVGKFARNKPNELQHKIKFGQLGTLMKPMTGTITDYTNLYKVLADTVKFSN